MKILRASLCGVSLLLSAALAPRAAGCSICRCGDPTFNALGAALFVLSDSLLAWNRFRNPFPAAQALIHATYFPAQWLIAISTYLAWPVA